ncbi:MAG: DUF4190 domain-containing protein [Nanoarchaeota archaeon]|nr:DUF4190 domain-containing protein [Nanoarchaeota archaeon]MBU1632634.1 DUF4190 domain-containing protein [Nanoarchaeota archaeon]MBU1876543.1 DUF4190 domain-containing protein [Nanoarchaeota archaeon]
MPDVSQELKRLFEQNSPWLNNQIYQEQQIQQSQQAAIRASSVNPQVNQVINKVMPDYTKYGQSKQYSQSLQGSHQENNQKYYLNHEQNNFQHNPQHSSQHGSQHNYEELHSEFAFVSLLLGVFGLILPLFSTLAIIFGITGLMHIHREELKGKWMAITGIVLGFLGIILIIIAIIFGIGFLENYLLQFGGIDTLIETASKIG